MLKGERVDAPIVAGMGGVHSDHRQVKRSQWLTEEYRTIGYQTSNRCLSERGT